MPRSKKKVLHFSIFCHFFDFTRSSGLFCPLVIYMKYSTLHNFPYRQPFEYLTVLISTQTSTQCYSSDNNSVFRICFSWSHCFSEMASQKWIVFFVFLALFIFMVEARVRTSSHCRVGVIDEFKETINAAKNCHCMGKSPNFPLEVKRRPDE